MGLKPEVLLTLTIAGFTVKHCNHTTATMDLSADRVWPRAELETFMAGCGLILTYIEWNYSNHNGGAFSPPDISGGTIGLGPSHTTSAKHTTQCTVCVPR